VKKEEVKDEDWTKYLFPNQAPIEVFKDRVWIIEGLLNKIKRNMMIYKMNNGKLLVHSVVCCDAETMKKVDSWGEIGIIYIPNLQHTYDCVRYSARYPKADIVAPGNMIAEIKKAKNLTPLNALEYFQKNTDLGVKAYFPEGLKKEGAFGIGGELFLEVDLGNGDFGLSFCDILMHNTADKGFMSKLVFGSKLGVPRVVKYMVFSNVSGTKKNVAIKMH